MLKNLRDFKSGLLRVMRIMSRPSNLKKNPENLLDHINLKFLGMPLNHSPIMINPYIKYNMSTAKFLSSKKGHNQKSTKLYGTAVYRVKLTNKISIKGQCKSIVLVRTYVA